MNAYSPVHVANIVTPEGEVYEIYFNVSSYSVPRIKHTTKRGQVRGCYGCATDLEAFRVAKALARRNGVDTKGWTLKRLGGKWGDTI